MAGEDDNPTVPLGERGANQTAPLPDASAQWVLATPQSTAKPRRRRRVWPWFVIGAAALVVVAAAIIAEPIARGIVQGGVRDRVITELDLPADQPIDVQITGPVLPQLILGTFAEISISSQDVSFDAFTGDVSVVAQGVPVRGGDMAAGSAEIRMDEQQLRSLLSTVDGFPAEQLELDAPDVTMSIELSVFGFTTLPIGVALTPSAADGELVLTPASIEVGGIEVSADQLRDQLGGVVDTVARDWPVCVAQYLPAGVELTAAAVVGVQFVAGFDIDGGIVSDPALLENGTCG
ncbi:LmeA family phospholipid-binding protein [Microbacter sp. GSS18]|nr:LmeA family phospholipid-binding protein [Microbacter sp. GSS18]